MPKLISYLGKPLVLIAALAVIGLWVRFSPSLRPPLASQPAGAFSSDPLSRVRAATTAEVPGLIRLACDADWRVRAAAFTALDQIHPLKQMPARDTPMAEREEQLLGWISRHAEDLRIDLCDVFSTAPTAQFGTALVTDCLGCHAGPPPARAAGDQRCADCHTDIHAQWAGSAHANSLTHLVLPTVDQVSRVQGHHTFDGRLGMSCSACHQPSGDHNTCVATFTARSCQDCHADTAAQWQQWSIGDRPTRAPWPPGSLASDSHHPAASCTQCHMPGQSHRWSARRNPALLAGGIDLDITLHDQNQAQLRLTNLAGHGYPTGSTRRALEIWIRFDQAPPYRLASLSPASAGGDLKPEARALDPGEQRVWNLPGQPSEVHCQLIYVRNRFDAESYQTEVASLTWRVPGGRP